MRRRLPAMLVLAALAGCAQSPPLEQQAPDVPASVYVGTFGEDGGAIVVTVITIEAMPISNATVFLEGSGVSVLSDLAGRVTFSELAPGPYAVTAEAPFFESASRSVDVLAQETAAVTLTLSLVPGTQPFQRTSIHKGLISCGAMIIVTNPATNCSESHKEKWEMIVDPGLATVVTEMTWQPNQALSSKELKLYLWQNVSSTGVLTGKYRYVDKTGPSPIYGRADAPFDGVEQEKPLNADGQHLFMNMGRPALQNSEPPFVAIILDQSFTIYTTEFYRAPGPDGFSSAPDA